MKIVGQSNSEVSTVPNLKGTVMTYNLTTKTIGTRTNSEIISDLGLATQTWVNTNFATNANLANYHKFNTNLLTTDTNNIIANTSNELYYSGLANSPYPSSQDVVGSISNFGGKTYGFDIASFNIANSTKELYYRSYGGAAGVSNWSRFWTSDNFNPDSYQPIGNYVTTDTIQNIDAKKTFTEGLRIQGSGVNSNTTKLEIRNQYASNGWAISAGINNFTENGLAFGKFDGTTFEASFRVDTDHTIYTANHGSSAQWQQAYNWGNHAIQGYLTSVSLNGYVPYTGATTDVDLGAHRIKAEGVALGAIPNTLRITKQLGDTIGVLSESNGWGKVFAANYIVYGGTSSHFLKGDGSLDNNTYATQTWVQNNYGNGIQLNTEFTTFTSNSLAITDNHIGDESGLTDTSNNKLVAGIREVHYKYGSTFDMYEGINIHKTSNLVGIGMYSNIDKLEVNGNISVDTGNGQLIVNPTTNTDGDLSFIRNAHVYCATDVNVKLPIEPIEGQRFVIHNTGASFIIIKTNLGNSTKLNERMKMELIYLGGKYLIDGSAQSFYEL